MSVELLQGHTGGGKSHSGMIRVREHLIEGGVVGLNFRLTEDWAYIMALTHPCVLSGEMTLDYVAESLYKRCFYIGDPSTLEELVKQYNKRCIGKVADRVERRVFVVIDEAQLFLNAREWRKNAPWVQLFTQHRKMGLDLLLIAHHIKFVDSQARDLISYVSRVVNLQEDWRIPLLDIRFPFPFFIYTTKPRVGGGRGSWRLLRFNPAISEMYDSYEIFAHDALSGTVETQGVISSQLHYYGNYTPKPVPVLKCGRTWWNSFDPSFSGLAGRPNEVAAASQS
jgi:hypothetical protein